MSIEQKSKGFYQNSIVDLSSTINERFFESFEID